MKIKKIGKISAWTVATTANVVVTLLLLASAYGGMVDPAVTSAGALVAMLFPTMLVMTLVFLAINIFLFRRLAVVNILALLACAGPIFTYSPVNFGKSRPAAGVAARDTFSLITYNIFDFDYIDGGYDGETPNRTVEYLIKKNADILVLQEALHANPLSRWRFDRAQIDSLRNLYPYKITSKTGLTIMSKFPTDTVAVAKKAFEGSFTADFACYRLNVEGRVLHIFNVHLQSIGLTRDDKQLYRTLLHRDFSRRNIEEARRQLVSKLSEAFRQRALQAKALRQCIDSIGGNVIVCGDFNDIPGCYATRVVAGDDFSDAYRCAATGPAITYYANKFYFRIDHIFYRGDLEAVYVSRDKLKTSDHYPLYAVFEWTDDSTATKR